MWKSLFQFFFALQAALLSLLSSSASRSACGVSVCHQVFSTVVMPFMLPMRWGEVPGATNANSCHKVVPRAATTAKTKLRIKHQREVRLMNRTPLIFPTAHSSPNILSLSSSLPRGGHLCKDLSGQDQQPTAMKLPGIHPKSGEYPN